MKIIKSQKNHSITLVVLNQKDEVVDASQSPDSNSIHQERLRQSRIKFNLASALIVMSATFCFTGVALFWSGRISEQATITTVDLVSRIVTSYCLPLIKSAKTQLYELEDEEENDQ